jgi:hypothetical protein
MEVLPLLHWSWMLSWPLPLLRLHPKRKHRRLQQQLSRRNLEANPVMLLTWGGPYRIHL